MIKIIQAAVKNEMTLAQALILTGSIMAVAGIIGAVFGSMK